MPEHADGDHLVKGAVELVAAAHVADQHEVGTDHAGQLEARVRLADHAQAAQSIMPTAAVTRPPGQPPSFGALHEAPLANSVNEFRDSKFAS